MVKRNTKFYESYGYKLSRTLVYRAIITQREIWGRQKREFIREAKESLDTEPFRSFMILGFGYDKSTITIHSSKPKPDIPIIDLTD